MVAELHDHKPPLLDIDVDLIENLRDKSFPWAEQRSHKSRMPFELQETRQVVHRNPHIPSQLSKGPVWKSMATNGTIHESLHHSVVASKAYSYKSKQFETLHEMKRGKCTGAPTFERSWEHAAKPGSLLPTEERLKWLEKDVKRSAGMAEQSNGIIKSHVMAGVAAVSWAVATGTSYAVSYIFQDRGAPTDNLDRNFAGKHFVALKKKYSDWFSWDKVDSQRVYKMSTKPKSTLIVKLSFAAFSTLSRSFDVAGAIICGPYSKHSNHTID